MLKLLKLLNQNLKFLKFNKIKKIINCAGHQVNNYWEKFNINYLSLDI